MKKSLVILLVALAAIVVLLFLFSGDSTKTEPNIPIDEEVLVALR